MPHSVWRRRREDQARRRRFENRRPAAARSRHEIDDETAVSIERRGLLRGDEVVGVENLVALSAREEIHGARGSPGTEGEGVDTG